MEHEEAAALKAVQAVVLLGSKRDPILVEAFGDDEWRARGKFHFAGAADGDLPRGNLLAAANAYGVLLAPEPSGAYSLASTHGCWRLTMRIAGHA